MDGGEAVTGRMEGHFGLGQGREEYGRHGSLFVAGCEVRSSLVVSSRKWYYLSMHDDQSKKSHISLNDKVQQKRNTKVKSNKTIKQTLHSSECTMAIGSPSIARIAFPK